MNIKIAELYYPPFDSFFLLYSIYNYFGIKKQDYPFTIIPD